MKIFNLTKVAVLAAAIAATPLTAHALDRVRVGYQRLPPLVTLIHGIETGIFTSHGIDLQLVVVNTGSDVINGLAANSMDIAGIPAAGGIQARAAGLPLTAIGTSAIERFGDTEFQIVAAGDRGIASARDLEGRVVGILEPESPAELHIREHVLADGANPDKITYVALPFPQLPTALEVGNVDAIGVAPPFLGQILASDKITPVVVGEGMIASLEEDKQAALGSWYAMQPWVESGNNRDVAARFLRALSQSNRELMKNRAAIDQILVRDFGMPPEAAAHIPMKLETGSLTAQPSDYAPVMRAYQRTGMADIQYTVEELVTTITYE